MKIDRMLYEKFEDKVRKDPNVQEIIKNLDIDAMEWYLKDKVFDKPTEFFNIPKLEQALGIDRKITVKEVAMNILGLLTGYKSKKEKLVDEFNNCFRTAVSGRCLGAKNKGARIHIHVRIFLQLIIQMHDM